MSEADINAPSRAQVRCRASPLGWCKQPNGVFVRALKVGATGDEEAAVVAKEYPHPTLEQLNKNGEIG